MDWAKTECLFLSGTPTQVKIETRWNSSAAALLQRKKFIDVTGNNINHPNDYLSRVYAVTLLQTLAGYDAKVFNR